LKENFGKKVGKALTLLRQHIHPEACFFPIKPDKNLRPIKMKSDLPKFQVTSRQYLSISNPQAFLLVTQHGGRVIKDSGIMGFKGNPQMCLDDAGGDLRILNCSIFYKRCQEVGTIAKLILLGVPNSIDDKQIQRIMDRELVELEIDERMDPKPPAARYDTIEWVKYQITREYFPGMPWKGIEEKWEQVEQGWYTCCRCIIQTMIKSKCYWRL
jgi:hypothetical protein